MNGVRIRMAGGAVWTPHLRTWEQLRERPHIARRNGMWGLYSLAGKQSRVRCTLWPTFAAVAGEAKRMYEYQHRS